MTAGNYWVSQLDQDAGAGQLIWPRVLVVSGLPVRFASENVAAHLYTPLQSRGAAIGFIEPVAQRGGSVETSLAQTFHERREQLRGLRLGKYLDPFNAAANSFNVHAQAFFSQQIADPVAARQPRAQI